MIKIVANIFMITTLLYTNLVCANDEVKGSKIEVSVDIFSLKGDISDINLTAFLKQQGSKGSTIFYTKAGESTAIDIEKNVDTSDANILMDIKVNDTATKYDIDFQLADGKKTSIHGINSYDLGNDLAFTAQVNGESKLIKVVTNLIDGNQPAMTMLELSKKIRLVNPSQQYFEEDKLWKKDNKRFKKLNRKFQQGPFYYLTNTDQTQVIKGVIEFKTGLGRRIYAREGNIGIRNFALKKNGQLPFVILPGKTLLIGHWDESVGLKIKEASFLSKEKIDNLKANSKYN